MTTDSTVIATVAKTMPLRIGSGSTVLVARVLPRAVVQPDDDPLGLRETARH
jgi:hypothetical protein